MTSNILSPFVLCAASIYLDKDNRSNTYCMREKGHPDEQVKGFPGGHNTVNESPAPEKTR